MAVKPQMPEDILGFWFATGMSEKWFAGGEEFNTQVRERFGQALDDASSGGLDGWKDTIEGRLALVIVLDQFSRNIHAGDRQAYASDAEALSLAGTALRMGDDIWLKTYRPDDWRTFLYLPFMHSEVLEDQRRCLDLYEMHGPDHGIAPARHHLDIIARFGRFPHRNAVLGRASTPEELAFLSVKDTAA